MVGRAEQCSALQGGFFSWDWGGVWQIGAMTARGAASKTIEDADAWFTTGRFALILGVLMVVCFPQVIFGFETFFFRDYGIFGYSLAFYQRESFWRGEIPLWNPLNDCGL